jgi:hypothetical protein
MNDPAVASGKSTITAAPEGTVMGQAAIPKDGRSDWCRPALHRLCVDRTADTIGSGVDLGVSATL